MAAPSPAFPPASPADAVRQSLIASFYHDHRPELADLLASAALSLDPPGLWVQPSDASLNRAWLEEQLLAAALAASVPLAWVHVVRPGREAEA